MENSVEQIDLSKVPKIKESNLSGYALLNQYVVGRLIDKGSFGSVYTVRDLKNTADTLVVKFCKDTQLLQSEISIMN